MNKFWNDNGTKVLGGLTAVLGTLASLIAAGAFKDLLSPISIGWLNIFVSLSTAGVGGATVARGFTNTAQAKVAQAMDDAVRSTHAQGGFGRLPSLLVTFAAAFAVLLISACATPPQKVLTAACERNEHFLIERCAQSLPEVYEVYQKRILSVVSDPTTPADIKAKLKRLELAATPLFVELARADATYIRIKRQLATGQTQEEQFIVANQNLVAWVAKADEHIRNIIRALGG